MKRDYRGLAVLLLAAAVGIAVLVFAGLAILDLYKPPQDERLGRQAMTVGAGAVAGAMSLIGVYLGMGAGDRTRYKDEEADDGDK